MTRERVSRALTWFVGIVLIALGLVEVAVRLAADEPVDWTAVLFFGGSLIGGGGLVLLGSFGLAEHRNLGRALFVLGCVLGILATAWTLVLPAVVLVVLFLGISSPEPAADAGRER